MDCDNALLKIKSQKDAIKFQYTELRPDPCGGHKEYWINDIMKDQYYWLLKKESLIISKYKK